MARDAKQSISQMARPLTWGPSPTNHPRDAVGGAPTPSREARWLPGGAVPGAAGGVATAVRP